MKKLLTRYAVLLKIKQDEPVGVLVGNLVSAAEAKAIRAKQGNGAIILHGGKLYDVTSDTLSQNHARHMRSPLIQSAQDSVKLMTGSCSTDGSARGTPLSGSALLLCRLYRSGATFRELVLLL